MTVLVCPLHWYYRVDHVDDVAGLMANLGPPALRGHVVGNLVLLAEGTHRIRAAHRLRLTPIIRAVPWWRSRQALVNARFAAEARGLRFESINTLEKQ